MLYCCIHFVVVVWNETHIIISPFHMYVTYLYKNLIGTTFGNKKKWHFSLYFPIVPIFYSKYVLIILGDKGFPGGSDGKEPVCNTGDPCSIPGLGRSPGEGNGNPFQYSCLENPMDGAIWQSIVHGLQRVAHNWVTNNNSNDNSKRGQSDFKKLHGKHNVQNTIKNHPSQ